MNECLNWASVSDKSSLGEPLTVEERLFLRSHPSGCLACATEATLLGGLESALEDPARLTTKQANPEPPRGQRQWLERLVPAPSSPRRPVFAAVAVASLAAAASAAVWVGSRGSSGADVKEARTVESLSPSSVAAAASAGGARLSFSAGDTLVDQHLVVAGEQLSVGSVVTVGAGQACLLVPPGVSVCLDNDTKVSVETLEGERRRFRLHRGRAVAHLNPQPLGSTFGFETAAGSVVAKGTAFSLVADGDRVTLRVHEGVVVSSRGNQTNAHEAPSSALLSREHAPSPVLEETASDTRLVELAKYFGDQARGTLVVSAAAGSSVALGEFRLGATPLSALVQPGDYRMEVSRAGFAPVVERLTFEAGARTVRNYEPTAELPAASSPPAKSAHGSAPSTAAELLSRARELRAGGRYKDANGVYQRLIREHASSAEARVALVSLGDLQLSQLGDAGAALRSFEAYLRVGGALRQEASYGRVKALRRLGRSSEARGAADAFVNAYPNSVQAGTLRKELSLAP